MNSSDLIAFSSIISAMFSDVSFVNRSIASDCSEALHRVIVGNANSLSYPDVVDSVMLAYSSILGGVQATAPLMVPSILANIDRVVSLLQSIENMSTAMINTPSFILESYNLGSSASTALTLPALNLSMEWSEFSAIPVASTVLFKRNFRNFSSLSPEIRLYMRFATEVSQVFIVLRSMDIVLSNDSISDGMTGKVACDAGSLAEAEVVDCGLYGNFTVLCPAQARINYEYACPASIRRPRCLVGSLADGPLAFSKGQVRDTFNLTIPECIYSINPLDFLLDGANQSVMGVDLVIANAISNTPFTSKANLVAPLIHSPSIFTTVDLNLYLIGASIVICTLLFLVMDAYYARRLKTPSTQPSVEFIFDRALGTGFQQRPWHIKWWNSLLDQHILLHLFQPRTEFDCFRTQRWVLSMGSACHSALLTALLLYFDAFRSLNPFKVPTNFLDSLITMSILDLFLILVDGVFEMSLSSLSHYSGKLYVMKKQESIQAQPGINLFAAVEAQYLIQSFNETQATVSSMVPPLLFTSEQSPENIQFSRIVDLVHHRDVAKLSSCLGKVLRKELIILQSIECQLSSAASEVYLLQEFVIHCLHGSRQSLARSIILPRDSRGNWSSYLALLGLLWTVITIAGAPFILTLIVPYFDSERSTQWKLAILYLICSRLLVSQPLFLLLKFVFISRMIHEDILSTFRCIRMKFSDSSAQFENLRDNLALRFNPAYRAAKRLIPLRAAKVIASLSDSDLLAIHKNLEPHQIRCKSVSLHRSFKCFLFSLPEFLHDAFVEALTLIIVVLVVALTYLAVIAGGFLPLVLAASFLLLGCCWMCSCALHRRRRAVSPGVSDDRSHSIDAGYSIQR